MANRWKVTNHVHAQFGITTELRKWIVILVSSSQTRNYGRESDRKNGNETHQFLIMSSLLKSLYCSTTFTFSYAIFDDSRSSIRNFWRFLTVQNDRVEYKSWENTWKSLQIAQSITFKNGTTTHASSIIPMLWLVTLNTTLSGYWTLHM